MSTATADPTETISATLENFRRGIPGVYEGVPAEEYHLLDAASASRLKKLARSPLHCHESIANPEESTPAMILGSAEHCAVLQPELFTGEYVEADRCSARKNKKSADRCPNQGKHFGTDHLWYCGTHEPDEKAVVERQILSAEDYARCKAMHAAVWSHPAAMKALSAPGPRELSVTWIDKATGQLCKIRVDLLTDGVAWDLKTTRDASPEGFAWQVRQLKYDLGAAFYLRGLAAAGLVRDGFGFIPFESDPPHAVAVYTLDDLDLTDADIEVFKPDGLLAEYAKCTKSGEWPGYSQNMRVLRLPSKRRDATV